jgi:major membrane immunogen (membrane-anchored lipoprotein)
MKKFLVLLSVLLLVVLGACSNSDVKTGSTGNSTEKKTETNPTKETPKVDNTKTVDATSQSVNAAGMQVGLGEIKIQEDKISVGINIANTTNAVLNFYPDQGHLVIGDMQLDANMFMTEGDIGGDVQGGVKQDAVLVFTVPEGKKIDIKTVTQLKLILGDVVTADYMTNKPVEFIVPVK